MDGWIAALKADLIINGRGVTPQYQESLKQASAKGQEYIDYVNQLYDPGAVGASVLPIFYDLLKLLPDMSYKIWKDYQDAANKKRGKQEKNIIEQLDTLKWESFDKI